MAWTQTPEITITDRATLSYNITPGQGAQFVGVALLDVPSNSYMRFGYLWVLAPLTIGSDTFQTRISVGSIWYQAHRYPVVPASIITAIGFKPAQMLPLPQRLKLFWFVG